MMHAYYWFQAFVLLLRCAQSTRKSHEARLVRPIRHVRFLVKGAEILQGIRALPLQHKLEQIS